MKLMNRDQFGQGNPEDFVSKKNLSRRRFVLSGGLAATAVA